MNSKIFETSSRKLENFLFAHDIQHIGFYTAQRDAGDSQERPVRSRRQAIHGLRLSHRRHN